MPLVSHVAIWPEADEQLHRQRIEAHFGVRLTAGESSYYNSCIWRWRPPIKRRWWQRPASAPTGLVEIRLYDNLDPLDGCPFYDGFPTGSWIVDISTDAADITQHAKTLLTRHGKLVP